MPATPKYQEFILLHRQSIKHSAIVLLALATVLLIFRWQAILHLNTHLIGGASGDAGLYLWLLRSNMRDLFSLTWFNTKAFYPYSQTLAWSDSFILPSILLWPFCSLGAPVLTCFNSFILVCNLLTGFLTYKLGYQLIGKTLPALIAGIGFMTWPFLTEHLGHSQLQSAFWIPLSLIILFKYFAKPKATTAFFLGCCITATFLCAVYYALFILLLILTFIISLLIIRPNIYSYLKLPTFIWGFLTGLLPIAFFLLPYFATKDTFGERRLFEAFYFSATTLSYLSSTANNLLYSFSSNWSHAEAQLFPGLLISTLSLAAIPRLWSAKPIRNLMHLAILFFLLVAVCSLPGLPSPNYRYIAAAALWCTVITVGLLCYRMGILERKLGFSIATNRTLLAMFFVAATIFFALSFGPMGNPEKNQYSLGFFSLIYNLVPGFDALRAIGRAGIVSIFCLYIVAAFMLSNLIERSQHASALAIIALALVITENTSLQYPLEPLQTRSSVFDYLDNQVTDKQAALLILPLTERLNPDGTVASWSNFARLNTQYMHWAFDTKLNLVNGYSGQRSKLMKELPAQTIGFPDQRSASALKSIIGLKYLLYVSANDPSFNKESFEASALQQIGNYKLLVSDQAGNYLFELVGESRIKTDTFLLAPSYPKGKVYLELMAGLQSSLEDVILDIFAPDLKGDAVIASVNLKPNSQWETYIVQLPESLNRTRPLVLAAKSRDGSSVYLRETRFEIGE